MLGPGGASSGERFVAEGRLAAAIDLGRRLEALDQVGSLHFLAAEPEQREQLRGLDAEVTDSPEDFHFGEALTSWAKDRQGRPLAYFGGGSAPLLSTQGLTEALGRVVDCPARYAFVNNAHSTDWGIFVGLSEVGAFLREQTEDNGLGWGLGQECGFQVDAAEPSAASRCDIDTPLDLVMLRGHPSLGRRLESCLASWQEFAPLYGRAKRLRELLATPASSLAVIGRSSSAIWSQLEKSTQVWVRMLAEERGMLASGRLRRGEVRSIVAELAARLGPQGFVQWLSETVDGAFWDTRVWMAARGGWPPAEERFAFDLGLVGEVEDTELRRWGAAIADAPIPILAGGHGVVAGGLFALLETKGMALAGDS